MSRIEMNTEKELYEAKLDAELREANARLEMLRAKIAIMAIDIRATIAHELSRLTMHKATVAEKLAEIRGMGETGWEKVCDGLDTARRELADGLESLALKMR